MINYIPMNNTLRLIPKALLRESSQADFLSWMLDALRALPSVSFMEQKVSVFQLSDYKLCLPDDIKQINLVTYLASEPCQDELDSLSNCICNPESEGTDYSTENVCRYTLAYKQFLDTPYYNRNYLPLKYSGMTSSVICKDCPNRYVSNSMYTFWIDYNRTLHTTLKDGYLCIDYSSELCDENGNYLIPDFPEVENYLSKYAIYKHWEERSSLKEESAFNMYQKYQQEAEVALKRARGRILLGLTDHNTVSSIVGNTYQKLIKIPEKYVYAR